MASSREAEDKSAGTRLLSSLSPRSLSPGSHAQEMAQSTVTGGLPTSINVIMVIPHKHSQTHNSETR